MRTRIVAVACIALFGAATALFGILEPLDARLLDAEFKLLRRLAPREATQDVVIVGIDTDAIKKLPEPVALWHRHLGKFFKAMAEAKAAVVGVDLILPDRSAEPIAPGYDAALMQGIVAMRRDSALVLGLTVDAAGIPHVIHKPFLAVAGEGSTGYVIWRADPDGVVRRFNEGLTYDGRTLPTLAGQMARRIGVQPKDGLVDFWRGAPFDYVPLTNVLDWYDSKDIETLKKHFSGKAVFLGVLLPFEDRVRMAVPLWAAEPDSTANPGVMVHAQALRSMLGNGLIKSVPRWIIGLIAALSALLWLAGAGPWVTLAGFIGLVVFTLAATSALLTRGWYAPGAAVMLSGGLALGGRLLYDTALRMRDLARLRNAFAGSVSPQVLAEITAGRLSPTLAGARSRIAVVFLDVRDFTARSEVMPPETVIALLNRYFEQAIAATHANGGTVDKFMGDGIMAFFGAPQQIDQPAAAAVKAGQEMLARMGKLNAVLRSENLEPIVISIGIHAGEAVVGHIGSAERHEYTAIGDVVNVASRLESLTKEVGYALVCTGEVIKEIPTPHGFVELGARPIRGHTPVELFGYERRAGRRPDPKPE